MMLVTLLGAWGALQFVPVAMILFSGRRRFGLFLGNPRCPRGALATVDFDRSVDYVDRAACRGNESGVCGPADERELYDLDADPFELDNRAGDPGYAAEQTQLHARLEELRDCAGIVGRDDPVPSSSGFCG